MQLRDVGRRSITDDVAAQLRGLIQRGDLSAGDRLPSEAELTRQLGVGRNALREAVGRLTSLGLIDVRRGRGMFVGDGGALASCAKLMGSAVTLSSSNLVDVAELRCVIEVQACRRAAELASDEQLDEMEVLFATLGDESLSLETAIHADFAFHQRIIEIAGNELFLNLTTILHEMMIEAIAKSLPKPRDCRVELDRHQPILEAMKLRDPDAAEGAMREHLKLFWSGIVSANGGE